MTVEKDPGMAAEQPEQGDASAQLVHEEVTGIKTTKLIREHGDSEDQVYLACYGREDGESSSNIGREDGVATYTNIKSS